VIVYFLPSEGRFGGVKVGCQFVEALSLFGLPAVLALPGGRAPTWMTLRAPVVDSLAAEERLTGDDWAFVNFPYDYPRLKGRPARLALHCQGTDPLLDPIFADPSLLVLTCWEQAARHAREGFGREPVEVGIEVSPCFFGGGEERLDNRVAYMPRRGYEIVRACMRACPGLDFVPIDGLDEAGVAGALKGCGVYLATSVGEWFGLPALEALAAGCLVVTVPVLGGMEYLLPGETCVLAAADRLPAALAAITQPGRAAERARLRLQGTATAWDYHPAFVRRRLKVLLEGPLRELT
jgi:hypothetical protein